MPLRQAAERKDRSGPRLRAVEAAADGNIPGISDREQRYWRSQETGRAEFRRFPDGQEVRSQACTLQAPLDFHPGRRVHTATWWLQVSGNLAARRGCLASVPS